MTRRPEFSTSQFEFAHGKKPRGNGTWAFFFDSRTDVETVFWHTGSFAEAKAAAMAEAARVGARRVSVGS